jgi:hypothetical protein
MATSPYAGGNTNRPIDAYLQDECSVATGLTATPGGTQAAALALTKTINNVTTCATAADSVKLPLAALGARVVVRNSGAASMQVFGSGTDTINAVATATGVAVGAGKTAEFHCDKAAPAGNWIMILSA